MTIEGAIADLQNLIDNELIPFWVKPSLRKIKETVEMEWEQRIKESKTGRWIITARNGVLCSKCKSGTRKMPTLFGNPMYKYCPFCGIKMEGKDADSD